ncbi:MAG: ergothioneine biosynthesis protein EgtB [Candidatus Tectomicrobia bacterium]|uniref:Ergothioneine biosynthesis protein EgtB n=1 Tax=Tectimicrobiota bacterium TaxID=2528274 RepID=A0A937W2H1_UNCTE|nr:ergothioneine biosynthesis protein EgtB [Candidatus Tectomicrobia bacterium]
MQLLQDKHFALSSTALTQLCQDTRERTLALVTDLEDTQFEVPLLSLVNPLRWELGHVTFFYETFVLQMLGQSVPLLAGAEDWYDSFKVDHDDRWSLPLPSRQQTFEYMRRVSDAVCERLQGHTPSPQETYLYLLSVLHEDMHGEALTYMRQTLGYARPRVQSLPASTEYGPWPGDVDIPGGTYYLGATPEQPFVFDNEKWAHAVAVAPFQIARAPVTNAAFIAFVEDGGYQRRECWSMQGWVWRTKAQAQQPVYWQRDGQGWVQRHFDTMIPLAPHAPVVHVTWYEAEAYCQWAGRRLPTEAEWEMAASAEPTAAGTGITGRKRRYPWGDEAPTAEHANLDTRVLGCVDVAAFPAGDSAFGCRQMAGNIWEWTESAFYPFPGYLVDYPYREYSAPWFGYRKVLKGGAWATRARLAYNTYRNFFPPARNDVYAGFRTCAR